MSNWSVALPEGDVQFYREIAAARAEEALAWSVLRDRLQDYIIRYVDIDNDSQVEDLHSIYLPDLVDDIVATLKEAVPEQERM